MWYTNNVRRHLCDMHISDWSDEFLSKFSPEKYLENLKLAKVESAMIYFQSHVGLCYWPTKSGKMHNAFQGRENMMQELCNMCRAEGIKVIGYYSLIYNNWAHDHYPEWRMVGVNGKSYLETNGNASNEFAKNKVYRYGLCCPNNPSYRNFISKQIEEISNYFSFDGMFFDMLYWPHMCYCKYCKERWKKEVGGEIPTVEDWKSPQWLLHMEKRRNWMGQFAQDVTNEMKSLQPNISVEHNFASAVLPDAKLCVSEEVNNASDYTGGDLYGGPYKHSFTCKFYRNITKHQPFEYMFSRCTPTLSSHTMTKSKDEMRSSIFLTAAHHGATLVIDAIDPVGTMNRSIYKLIGDVFKEQIPYERYFKGDMVEDVGVYYSLRSKRNLCDDIYTNIQCAINTEETLVRKNILCGVTGDYHDIKQYKILVASCLGKQDELDNNRLIDYVEKGGNLYLSGIENIKLLSAFFNMEYIKRTDEKVVYIAPADNKDYFFGFSRKYPIHFDGGAPMVKGIPKSEVIAKLSLPYTKQNDSKFASIHSNPPGIETDYPLMAFKKYGLGKVFWSGLPLEAIPQYIYRNLFTDILAKYFKCKYTIDSDAPKDVEIVVFKYINSYLLSCTLLNEDYKARRVEDFNIKINVPSQPQSVLKLPERHEMEYKYDGNSLMLHISDFKMFDMYEISF